MLKPKIIDEIQGISEQKRLEKVFNQKKPRSVNCTVSMRIASLRCAVRLAHGDGGNFFKCAPRAVCNCKQKKQRPSNEGCALGHFAAGNISAHDSFWVVVAFCCVALCENAHSENASFHRCQSSFFAQGKSFYSWSCLFTRQRYLGGSP